MPKKPRPWKRRDRPGWFVQIDRKRHNLGADKEQAYQRYHELMARPHKRTLTPYSVIAVIDDFLDWYHKNREH